MITKMNDLICPQGSKSLWMETELPIFPPLNKNASADVCIVGAGIAGLTCAYTLANTGKSVIIIDQNGFWNGQSARTTGHLTWVLDDRFYNLERFFGVSGAKLAAQSHAAAIDYIQEIIEKEKIDCDFERIDGYLFIPPGETHDILEKEFQAISKIGMDIQRANRAPFSQTFESGPCLKFPNQAQFHSLKYLKGLIEALSKLDCKFYSNTHANHFSDGDSCTVKTSSGHTITSHSLIVSTCTPINNRVFIHTKQAAYRTYVIGYLVPKDSVQKGLYWDTADPYHYIRIQKHQTNKDLEWLLIGGEDHKTGQDQDIEAKYENLKKWAKERFSFVDKIDIKWSGQVYEPIDSLAFIGKNPTEKNTYIVTGDSGNGLTHGTIAGILIPDLILGKENPWRDLFNPSRKTLNAADEYLHENSIAVIQYEDWFTPGELKTIEQLNSDEGMILREGLKKIAVYKDKDGNIHKHSAFCPHLGGCVRWNSGEKSWDCPVHGSRFDGCGKVLIGPSTGNLKGSEE